MLFALNQTKGNEELATLANTAYPKLRHDPAAVNVACMGLDAALALPEDNATRHALLDSLESYAQAVATDRTIAVAADDRSSVFGSIIDARDAAHDSIGVRQWTERWAAFLDGEAERAKTPEQRAVFDSHRLSAYLALGQPERAVPFLQQSERDFPGDYNPPARLANAYKAMKRWDDALGASNRAMAKAYGPRKLLILQVRSEIYAGRGDQSMARQTLQDALAYAEALPDGQRSESSIASLKKKLEATQ